VKIAEMEGGMIGGAIDSNSATALRREGFQYQKAPPREDERDSGL